MNELRILSGGKKGTAIALYEGSFRIGSTFESTLMLGSNEIGDSNVTINVSDEHGCKLDEVLGNVLGLDGAALNPNDAFDIDSPIRIGDVWIAINEASAPWRISQPIFTCGDDVDALQQVDNVTSDTVTVTSLSASKKRKPIISRVGVNSLMVVLLAVGVGNYVYSRSLSRAASGDLSKDVYGDASVQRQEQERYEQQQKNLLIVNQMLDEREINNVSLAIENDNISVSGFVNGRDKEVLDRMLSRIKKNSPAIQISNKAKSLETSLPFEILSISFGDISRIIVEDHGVVVVGEEVEGYMLESITENKVRFGGAQSLEVNW